LLQQIIYDKARVEVVGKTLCDDSGYVYLYLKHEIGAERKKQWIELLNILKSYWITNSKE